MFFASVYLESHDLQCAAELVAQYADLPIDFAGAALVAICERIGIGAIASLNSDFHIYRLDGKDAFCNVFTIEITLW